MKSLFAKKHRTAGQLSIATLAPMVDIFTILVIAVLRASSPQAPLSLPEASMELPISQQETIAPELLILDIGKDGIYVDGFRVTSRQFWKTTKLH